MRALPLPQPPGILRLTPFCCCEQVYALDLTLTPPGCTNPGADNYDAAATVDDGSCVVRGCIDADATNYDPAATADDGSCMTGKSSGLWL